jgi:hypothetical protein
MISFLIVSTNNKKNYEYMKIIKIFFYLKCFKTFAFESLIAIIFLISCRTHTKTSKSHYNKSEIFFHEKLLNAQNT